MTNLILVDVDGVLNPSTPSSDHEVHHFKVMGCVYKVHLNPAHGQWLTELAVNTDSQLVWCTYWENHAPEFIAPVLGLPEMPVIKMQFYKMGISLGGEKAYSAEQYVGDSKFAYFDDEWDIGVNLKSPNGWHIWVDPDEGLTEKHIELAEDFLLRD